MSGQLRVAVVGAGPAGSYAVARLLELGAGSVEVFDRLPTPGGLVRAGVAPDHFHTKRVERTFHWWLTQPGVRLHLGVEVGRDISHADLAAHHHAVIYTTGASDARRLGIPGEDLPGCLPATDLVGWYNAHPEHVDHAIELDTERAVVIGNGNVALDVARVLALGPEPLRTTDISDQALAALGSSTVREVVVLGRRGPEAAAFTTSELIGLAHLPDIGIQVESPIPLADVAVPEGLAPSAEFAMGRKLALLRQLADRPARGSRRIVLRFMTAPVAVEGDQRVRGLRVARTVPGRDGRVMATSEEEVVETGLVLGAVGYRGVAVAGVPFDAPSGRIPNEGGRVLDGARVVPGCYVAGWIKRGPSGVIGTNRSCAHESVDALVADWRADLLPAPLNGAASLDALLHSRVPQRIGLSGWRAIDLHERRAGSDQSRPRVKVGDLSTLRALAGVG